MKTRASIFFFCAILIVPALCQASITVLTNASPNHTVLSGSNEKVYGTSASNQIILESGASAELINFPGQNSIQIQSSSDLFTVSRAGTMVTFQGSDGSTLKIPATKDVQTIFFNVEEGRVLQIHNNQVMLNDQEINTNPVSILTVTAVDIFQRLENHFYPKLFVQIQGWVETDVYDEAAQRDIIIMDTIAMEFCPSYLGEHGVIRSINPNAIILMYFSAADIMVPGWTDVLKQFVAGVNDEWYMKDDQGKTYPLFPNSSGWNYMFNPTTGVNVYMPEFINDNILAPGFADGIFFDWIVESVSWLNERTDGVICGSIDIDNDGIGDSSSKIDKLWIEGIKKLLSHARTKFPNGSIITGNGGWVFDGTYRFTGLNGRMVEQFLKGYSQGWDRFAWIEVMRGYYLMQEGAAYPRLPLVMTNGDQNDFKHMRYGLTSTLLFDGYSTYTNDQEWSENAVPYTANWWYDEYSVDIETGKAIKSMTNKGYLGSAVSDAYNAVDSDDLLLNSLIDYDPQTTKKIWRRDFQNGIVLVNPSTIEITIDLQGTFRKIIGIYDPVFNNGEILTKITMEPETGVVLLNCQ